MTKLKISNRLKSIGDLINDNSNIIDVGCDHGLLSIYIYLNKKNVNIIASDINKLPLESAKNNLNKYKLSDKIKLVLSDGLDSINDFYDTIIISGLGGNVIINILKKEISKLKYVNEIILSPQNNTYMVRLELIKLGYYIENELLIKENGKIYNIIKFKKGTKKYSKQDLLFGPILRKNKNELFYEYNLLKKNKYDNILNKLPQSKFLKRFKLKKYINIIKKEI